MANDIIAFQAGRQAFRDHEKRDRRRNADWLEGYDLEAADRAREIQACDRQVDWQRKDKPMRISQQIQEADDQYSFGIIETYITQKMAELEIKGWNCSVAAGKDSGGDDCLFVLLYLPEAAYLDFAELRVKERANIRVALRDLLCESGDLRFPYFDIVR